VNELEARRFAEDWIGAWNSHELDRILAHYSDAVRFASPFVARLAGEPGGILRGKPALRSYFREGLKAYPDLRFELLDVLVGVESVTLYYRSVGGRMAAEVMRRTEGGEVSEVQAHYSG
jgi:ketosteroid isomerase-like protein